MKVWILNRANYGYIYNCRSAFQDSFVRGSSPVLEPDHFEEDDAPLAVVCDDDSDEEDASEESEFEICPENEDDEVYMVSCSFRTVLERSVVDP
jgi:hypothetical protein